MSKKDNSADANSASFEDLVEDPSLIEFVGLTVYAHNSHPVNDPKVGNEVRRLVQKQLKKHNLDKHDSLDDEEGKRERVMVLKGAHLYSITQLYDLSCAYRKYAKKMNSELPASSKLNSSFDSVAPMFFLAPRTMNEHNNNREQGIEKKKGSGTATKLTDMEEKQIVDLIKKCADSQAPLDSYFVRVFAAALYAARTGDGKIRMFSYNWFLWFRKRHPEVDFDNCRLIPEDRIKQDRMSVYDSHWSALDIYKKKAEEMGLNFRMVNGDESGASRGKIQSARRKRCFMKGSTKTATGTEKGNTTTVVMFVDDSGNELPGVIVRPGKSKGGRKDEEKEVELTPVTAHNFTNAENVEAWKNRKDDFGMYYVTQTSNGFSTRAIFEAHFEKLKPYLKAAAEDSIVVVVLDGATVHMSIKVLEWFQEQERIFLQFLPPHTSHNLQPLDNGVFCHLTNVLDTYKKTLGGESEQRQWHNYILKAIREISRDMRKRCFHNVTQEEVCKEKGDKLKTGDERKERERESREMEVEHMMNNLLETSRNHPRVQRGEDVLKVVGDFLAFPSVYANAPLRGGGSSVSGYDVHSLYTKITAAKKQIDARIDSGAGYAKKLMSALGKLSECKELDINDGIDKMSGLLDDAMGEITDVESFLRNTFTKYMSGLRAFVNTNEGILSTATGNDGGKLSESGDTKLVELKKKKHKKDNLENEEDATVRKLVRATRKKNREKKAEETKTRKKRKLERAKQQDGTATAEPNPVKKVPKVQATTPIDPDDVLDDNSLNEVAETLAGIANSDTPDLEIDDGPKKNSTDYGTSTTKSAKKKKKKKKKARGYGNIIPQLAVSFGEAAVPLENVSDEKATAIKFLDPEEWISTGTIDWFNSLVNRFALEASTRTITLSTYWTSDQTKDIDNILENSGYESGDFDRVVIPFRNESPSHFYNIMLDRKRKHFVVMDSLQSGKGFYANNIAFIKSHIRSWIAPWLSKTRKRVPTWSDWKTVFAQDNNLKYPQQANGYDCGPFACLSSLFVSMNGNTDDDAWVSRTSDLCKGVPSTVIREWMKEVILNESHNKLLNPPKSSSHSASSKRPVEVEVTPEPSLKRKKVKQSKDVSLKDPAATLEKPTRKSGRQTCPPKRFL